jgi:predicted lipoprotein with Yx(FWY)xxD motif
MKRSDSRPLRRRTSWATIAVVPFAIIALAACGSSSSNTSASSPAVTATPNANAILSRQTQLGNVLTDAKGFTVYTLTNGGKAVPCTGMCATVWPPEFLPSGSAKPTSGAGVTGLGTTSVGGHVQVTEHGDPLYRYSGDRAPGDTNGEGINSFGGIWHAAQTTGSPSQATTPATTSSGGYGGAYP